MNASENLTAAMQGIEGRYRVDVNRRLNCGATPLQQSGERVQYVETYASYDGYTYHLRLRTEATLRGDAFENVTAPSDAG